MMEVYRMSSDPWIFFLCFQRVLLNLEKSFLKIQMLLMCCVLSWLLKNGKMASWWENDPDLLFPSSDKWWCSAQASPVPYRAAVELSRDLRRIGPQVQILTDPKTGIVTNTRYPEQMILPLKKLLPKSVFVQTEESINGCFYLKPKIGCTEFCGILQLIHLQLDKFC